jgi:hypothetical protein
MNSDRMSSIAISQTYALTYRLIASHVNNVDNSNNRLLAIYSVVRSLVNYVRYIYHLAKILCLTVFNNRHYTILLLPVGYKHATHKQRFRLVEYYLRGWWIGFWSIDSFLLEHWFSSFHVASHSDYSFPVYFLPLLCWLIGCLNLYQLANNY